MKGFLDLRYMLFMMGLFACYCGLVYNDFMSIPWNLFGSCYHRTEKNTFERDYDSCTYWFGIDPIVF